MSTLYAKPENALRKAKDLVRVGKPIDALAVLKQIFTSRRYRTWTATHEKIAIMYVNLAVDMKRNIKDALLQYRAICNQAKPPVNTCSASLEKVCTQYLTLCTSRTEKALAEAEKAKSDGGDKEGDKVDVRDLEDTPESIMMQFVNGENKQERADRQIVVPWVKYLWDCYRTILEVLRNNGKLIDLYHSTVRSGFKFCQKFSRHTEFRRLCETLRSHIVKIGQMQHQPNAVELSAPEVQALYLKTRFEQLDTASKMELWQEAYRTLEDIHDSMRLTAQTPSPSLMITYYRTLSDIFWASGNLLFHAYSLSKLFTLSIAHNKDFPTEERRQLADAVFLATLVIDPSVKDDNMASMYSTVDEGNMRLANLLGFKREIPTRARLLEGLLGSGLLNEVSADVKKAYTLLETDFGPLTMNAELTPALEQFKENEKFAIYVEPLKKVCVYRLLQQLQTVFKTMLIQKFCSLAPDLGFRQIERLIMYSSKNGQLRLTIDHRRQLLHFSDEPLNGRVMRKQLAVLASKLEVVHNEITPVDYSHKQTERKHVFKAVKDGVEEEHQQVFARQQVIESQKEEQEKQLNRERQEKEEAERKRAMKRAKEERDRLDEEAKAREEKRIKKEQDAKDLRAKKELADRLKKTYVDTAQTKNKAVRSLQKLTSKIEEVDKEELLAVQARVMEQEKSDKERHRKESSRLLNYMTRALRMEEAALIVKAHEQQLIEDKEKYETDFKKFRADHKKAFERALEERSRMMRMTEERDVFYEKLMTRRMETFEAAKGKQEEARRKLMEERRKEEMRRKREEDERQKEAEAKLALELAKKEEEERKLREKEEARRKKVEAEEERRRKLDEAAELRRKREEELEQRDQERRRGPPRREERPERSWGARSSAREEETEDSNPWRRGGSSGGSSYQPPSRRGGSGRGDDSGRRGDDSSERWGRRGGDDGDSRSFGRREASGGFGSRMSRRGDDDRPSREDRFARRGDDRDSGRSSRWGDRSERDAPPVRRETPRTNDDDGGDRWRRNKPVAREVPPAREPVREPVRRAPVKEESGGFDDGFTTVTSKKKGRRRN